MPERQEMASSVALIGIVASKMYVERLETTVDGQVDDYSQAIAFAGGAPVLVPIGLQEAQWRGIYERVDGLVFPGGDDIDPALYGEQPHPKLGWVDRALDEAELLLARWALADQKPVLGICRGIQLLNVAAGGTLYQDLPSQYANALPHFSSQVRAHVVQIVERSRLAAALGVTTCSTNSRHHQAVKDVGPGFVATAHTDDGVIEGIEHSSAPFCIGVQWHPENLVKADAVMLRLFQAFVQASAMYHLSPSNNT